MSFTERTVTVYECSSCGGVSRHETSCCGDSMQEVTETAVFNAPDLEQVSTAVFDISASERTICYALMTEGEATVDELASQFDRDRSSISRHLTHLVELGVAERESRTVDGGGRAYVYSLNPADEIRRRLTLGLHAWMSDAEDQVEELTQQKLEAVTARAADESGPETIDEEGSILSQLQTEDSIFNY